MAAGPGLLDDVFFSSAADEASVSGALGSLQPQLTHPGAVKLSAQTPPSFGLKNGVSATANTAQTPRHNNNYTNHNNNNSMGPGPERLPAGARLTSDGRVEAAGHLKPGLTPSSVMSAGTNLNGNYSFAGAASFPNSASAPSPVSSIVSNGPGCVVKDQPAAPGTVIRTSLTSPHTVIPPQTVALVRTPSMQNPVTVSAPNGPGSLTLNSGLNPVHLPTSNASLSLSSPGQVNKADSPISLTQTMTQAPVSLPQPIRTPIMQSGSRIPVPTSIGPILGGARAIAPQGLTQRMTQPQSQPSVQNIQLPPGMVLVRSESGQFLMIHQQTLAQIQSQSQGAIARPPNPPNTPPVHITPVQMTPTTLTKQTSPVPAAVQPTTVLQRPPVLQNTIMLGGTTAPSVGTPVPGQPGVAQRVPVTATTPAAATTETLENVKKCKNFLSTLIKLASSGKQSSETAANVKNLVKSLLEGKLEAEEFTSRLYKELNSSPQPYLVPFLKRSLPTLRQMTPDSVAFIQQSEAPPTSSVLTAAVLGSPMATQRPTTSVPPTTSVIATPTAPSSAPSTAATKTVLTSSMSSRTTLHQPSISIQHSRTTLPQQQTPVVSLRAAQPQSFTPHTAIRTQTHAFPTGSVLKNAVCLGNKVSGSGPPSLPSAFQKAKVNDAGSGSFRDDDDINDVASMAGVNLSEESDRILATNSDLVGAVTRSCKDETFLHSGSLHRRILAIGQRFGVSELGADVVNLVSHAAQQRLQSLLEKASVVAQQRNVSFKEDERYEQTCDIRAQLKFFEQLDQMERQRKDDQEREILMKAAKSRSRQEDPEQLRLKQKAKEMQQQELAQIRQRDANLTALAAIGPRKKRNVATGNSGSGPETVCGVSSGSAPAGSGGVSRQFHRQRITRVNLRDLLFCLENERETSHSHLLYKAFLK